MLSLFAIVKTMKRMVVIVCVALSIGAMIYFKAYEALIFFILTGHISIINFTVPPMIMLVFWILVVPASLIFYKSASSSFWKIIEFIGEKNQRKINRQARLIKSITPSRSLGPIIAIVLLQIASELPKSSISKPELSFRRRFLALPS